MLFSLKRVSLLLALFLGTIMLWGISVSAQTKLAAQIRVDVERDFTLSEQGEMSVREKERISNTYSDRFIPGGSKRSYYFVISAQTDEAKTQIAERIYSSMKLTINGSSANFERTSQDGVFGLNYTLTRRLGPNSAQTVEISYLHPELGERTGGLLDAYIPAFAEDFKFDLGSTTYKYTTRLSLPSSSGSENILTVEPLRKYTVNGMDVYEFAQENLKGKFVWVQRGSKQVYRFSIEQPLAATRQRDNGDINQYKLIIPRDIDEVNVSQRVYFTEITPDPVAIETDSEGNLIGVFHLPASQDTTVVMKGFAVLENKPRQELSAAGLVNALPASKSNYLQPAEFWEVSSRAVIDKARSIVPTDTTVFGVMSALYQDVVDSIDYSQVKRFGINDRQGALATLQGGAAVCMEYSDLYLTLLRARGIASRAAYGYGYDSRLNSNEQEAHQWVQVYLPGLDGWTGVDVTWGESGNKVIGGDLNHFYTHVASVSPDEPAVLSRLSWGAGVDSALVGPDLNIEALAQLPTGDYITPTQLQRTYPAGEGVDARFAQANFQSKFSASWKNLTTNPGNIDIIGWLMIAASLMLVLFTIYLLIRVIRRIWRRKPKQQEL